MGKMNDKDFIELFTKDCEYYDKRAVELNTILSLVDFKQNERLIDIGAGIGRLAIPLSKYVKVTAIDTNKALLDQIKDSNIELINMKVEDYYPKEKYDYALVVWPWSCDCKKLFEYVKKNILKEKGKLIVVKSLEHDLRKITKKIFPEMFGESKGFLEVLPDFFKTEKEKIIETDWEYPTFDEALRLIIFELEAFYDKKINPEQLEVIKEFIREREESGKIYMDVRLRVLVSS